MYIFDPTPFTILLWGFYIVGVKIACINNYNKRLVT